MIVVGGLCANACFDATKPHVKGDASQATDIQELRSEGVDKLKKFKEEKRRLCKDTKGMCTARRKGPGRKKVRNWINPSCQRLNKKSEQELPMT